MSQVAASKDAAAISNGIHGNEDVAIFAPALELELTLAPALAAPTPVAGAEVK